jgi:hypothetical protein
MNDQRKLIHKRDWDVLLVIDACRYDYFKNMHKEFFGDIGKLEMAKSPATWTGAWMVEIFHNKPMKDAIFISSHKWINSKGPSDEKVRIFSERLKYGKMIRQFDAKDYFKDVIDAWEFGYDEKIKGICPYVVTNETIKAIDKNHNHRVITKYWQVHDPYMYYSKEQSVKKAGFENVYAFLGNLISDEMITHIRRYLGRSPMNVFSLYYIKYGKEGIIKGYVEDLKITLKCIKRIVDRYPDKNIAITSDHGEHMGEDGRFGHGGRLDKEIIEVPWYEIPARNKR